MLEMRTKPLNKAQTVAKKKEALKKWIGIKNELGHVESCIFLPCGYCELYSEDAYGGEPNCSKCEMHEDICDGFFNENDDVDKLSLAYQGIQEALYHVDEIIDAIEGDILNTRMNWAEIKAMRDSE